MTHKWLKWAWYHRQLPQNAWKFFSNPYITFPFPLPFMNFDLLCLNIKDMRTREHDNFESGNLFSWHLECLKWWKSQKLTMYVDFQEMKLKPRRTMFFPLLRRKFDEMGDIFLFQLYLVSRWLIVVLARVVAINRNHQSPTVIVLSNMSQFMTRPVWRKI